MELLVDVILWGGVVPFVFAGVCLLIGSSSRRSMGRRRQQRAGVLAVGGGYLLAHLLVRWPWPVVESTDRLAFVALAVIAAGLWEAPGRTGLVLWRLVMCLGVPAWFLVGVLRHEPAVAATLQVTGVGLALFMAWTGFEALARRRDGPAVPLVLALTVVCGAAALALSATVLYARLAASLGAALAACAAVAWVRPAVSLARGAAGAATVLAGACWMAGVYLAELPVPSAALLLGSPLAGWVVQARFARRFGTTKTALLAGGAALVPAVAAVLLAALAAPPANPYMQ